MTKLKKEYEFESESESESENESISKNESENDKNNKNINEDIINDINIIENKTKIIDSNIDDLEKMSDKIKKNLENNQINIDDNIKDKLKKNKNNLDEELSLLKINNLKYKKYLEILTEKHNIELKFIEEICLFQTKKKNIADKYLSVDINQVQSIYKSYISDLNDSMNIMNEKKNTDHNTEQILKKYNNQTEDHKIEKNNNQTKDNKTENNKNQTENHTSHKNNNQNIKRRHTISEASINEKNIDFRKNNSLKDHLKDALANKFKKLNNNKENDDNDDDDNDF